MVGTKGEGASGCWCCLSPWRRARRRREEEEEEEEEEHGKVRGRGRSVFRFEQKPFFDSSGRYCFDFKSPVLTLYIYSLMDVTPKKVPKKSEFLDLLRIVVMTRSSCSRAAAEKSGPMGYLKNQVLKSG